MRVLLATVVVGFACPTEAVTQTGFDPSYQVVRKWRAASAGCRSFSARFTRYVYNNDARTVQCCRGRVYRDDTMHAYEVTGPPLFRPMTRDGYRVVLSRKTESLFFLPDRHIWVDGNVFREMHASRINKFIRLVAAWRGDPAPEVLRKAIVRRCAVPIHFRDLEEADVSVSTEAGLWLEARDRYWHVSMKLDTDTYMPTVIRVKDAADLQETVHVFRHVTLNLRPCDYSRLIDPPLAGLTRVSDPGEAEPYCEDESRTSK